MDTQAPGAWITAHRPQLRLSLRILVASLVAFTLGHILGLAQAYWAVLTAVIVMQASVGGSLKATLDRFLGSLGGAAWGVVANAAPVRPHMMIAVISGAISRTMPMATRSAT